MGCATYMGAPLTDRRFLHVHAHAHVHVHVYYHVLTQNFFVYYEIDNDESKHVLALSEHGYLTASRRCKARGFCWSKSEQ